MDIITYSYPKVSWSVQVKKYHEGREEKKYWKRKKKTVLDSHILDMSTF